MHIAILSTNTDDSDFAARHPRDGEKFARMMGGVRPGWRFTAFDLPGGDRPDLAGLDGVVIGGSPASVNDPQDWTRWLVATICDLQAAGVPMFGACFGHQAIAVALGGRVGANPGPFVLGVTEMTVTDPAPWMQAGPIRLAAAHGEQVLALPEGAVLRGGNAACPVGLFTIGSTVLACEYHPEMTPDFIAGLVEHLAPEIGPEAAAEARASLSPGAEGPRFAEWVARFFEAARR